MPSMLAKWHQIRVDIGGAIVDNGPSLVVPTAVDARLVCGSGDHPSQADSFGVSTWMGDRLAVC